MTIDVPRLKVHSVEGRDESAFMILTTCGHWLSESIHDRHQAWREPCKACARIDEATARWAESLPEVKECRSGCGEKGFPREFAIVDGDEVQCEDCFEDEVGWA